jgi:hypothetical protein
MAHRPGSIAHKEQSAAVRRLRGRLVLRWKIMGLYADPNHRVDRGRRMNSSANTSDVDRRRFLKQAAGVAWGVPVLLTLMSGPASAQEGAVCGTKNPEAIGELCDVTTPCATGFRCSPSTGQTCICKSA